MPPMRVEKSFIYISGMNLYFQDFANSIADDFNFIAIWMALYIKALQQADRIIITRIWLGLTARIFENRMT